MIQPKGEKAIDAASWLYPQYLTLNCHLTLPLRVTLSTAQAPDLLKTCKAGHPLMTPTWRISYTWTRSMLGFMFFSVKFWAVHFNFTVHITVVLILFVGILDCVLESVKYSTKKLIYSDSNIVKCTYFFFFHLDQTRNKLFLEMK